MEFSAHILAKETAPSVLTPSLVLFITKFSLLASPAYALPAFPKLFCIRIPLGQWFLNYFLL